MPQIVGLTLLTNMDLINQFLCQPGEYLNTVLQAPEYEINVTFDCVGGYSYYMPHVPGITANRYKSMDYFLGPNNTPTYGFTVISSVTAQFFITNIFSLVRCIILETSRQYNMC